MYAYEIPPCKIGMLNKYNHNNYNKTQKSDSCLQYAKFYSLKKEFCMEYNLSMGFMSEPWLAFPGPEDPCEGMITSSIPSIPGSDSICPSYMLSVSG